MVLLWSSRANSLNWFSPNCQCTAQSSFFTSSGCRASKWAIKSSTVVNLCKDDAPAGASKRPVDGVSFNELELDVGNSKLEGPSCPLTLPSPVGRGEMLSLMACPAIFSAGSTVIWKGSRTDTLNFLPLGGG